MRRIRYALIALGVTLGVLSMSAFCLQATTTNGSENCAAAHAYPQRGEAGLSGSAKVSTTRDAPMTPTVGAETATDTWTGRHLDRVAVSVSSDELAAGNGDQAGHGHHAMLTMMCLAVLAVVLALLLPVIARSIGFFRLRRLSLTRLVPTLLFWADPGPPVGWRFSVIRC